MNPHGTLDRYRDGCTCGACVFAAARTDPDRILAAQRASARRTVATRALRHREVSSHMLVTGELAVECWCRHTIVYVAPEVVKACRTLSCGRRDCTEAVLVA